jgi:hypothetical protein
VRNPAKSLKSIHKPEIAAHAARKTGKYLNLRCFYGTNTLESRAVPRSATADNPEAEDEFQIYTDR